jgi:hypothetical protein
MPVVLLLTALMILGGVVVVAVGRGGELTLFRSDAAPLRQRLATAADMASFRPPLAFFGYSAQATDDALARIARSVAERDAELALLRDELATLRPPAAPAGDSPPADPPPPAPPAPPAPAEPEAPAPDDYGPAADFRADTEFRADGDYQ